MVAIQGANCDRFLGVVCSWSSLIQVGRSVQQLLLFQAFRRVQ